MKHTISAALVAVAAVLFSASTAFATTQKVHATIPFPFVVNGTVMPAGVYTIFPVLYGEIEVAGPRASALVSVIQATPDGGSSLKGSLEFDRIGGSYFLRGVEDDYAGIDAEIPVTKREKSARAGLAKAHQHAERVTVAAQ